MREEKYILVPVRCIAKITCFPKSHGLVLVCSDLKDVRWFAEDLMWKPLQKELSSLNLITLSKDNL